VAVAAAGGATVDQPTWVSRVERGCWGGMWDAGVERDADAGAT